MASRRIVDPQEIEQTLRINSSAAKILFWSTVGYGSFYFVRKNFSIAMPVMEKQLGLSKANLGLILTLHGLLYGVSKFFGGIAADRANARVMMSLALLASALGEHFLRVLGIRTDLLWIALVTQWIFSGVGISALRAIADALVFAEGIGNENVDLEHVALFGGCSNRYSVRLSCGSL